MSIRRGDDADRLDWMERFIALGASVDKYEGEDSSVWVEACLPRGPALHSASMRGNIGAFELLLSRGADPLRNEKIRSSEILGSSYRIRSKVPWL